MDTNNECLDEQYVGLSFQTMHSCDESEIHFRTVYLSQCSCVVHGHLVALLLHPRWEEWHWHGHHSIPVVDVVAVVLAVVVPVVLIVPVVVVLSVVVVLIVVVVVVLIVVVLVVVPFVVVVVVFVSVVVVLAVVAVVSVCGLSPPW